MGTLVSILLTLLAVGASYGLAEGADAINRKRAEKHEMSTDQILALISAKMDQIRSKSADAYNKLLNQFNSMPIVQEAGGLKSYMSKVRSKRSEQLAEAQKTLSDVEQKAANISNRANMLASQSNSYRNSSTGRNEFESIKKDAEDLNNTNLEVSNVEKAI